MSRNQVTREGVPTPAVKFTYEDYQHTSADQRYELLDGELIMAPAPNLEHQRVSTQLGWRLAQFAAEKGIGEVFFAPCDVVLSNTDVVQPDLLFVSHERAHLLLGGANVLGAPDLVVEILSPSTAGRDRTLKRALYAMQEYWQVDPDARTATVLRLDRDAFELVGLYGEGQTLTSPTLAGFAVDLNEIFGV